MNKKNEQEKTENALAEEVKQKMAEDQTAAVYRKYQENIKKSEVLKGKILLGAMHGENVHKLLLQAAECIGLLTGDNSVYATNMKTYILKSYGHNALT